jgi:hypothetical protein
LCTDYHYFNRVVTLDRMDQRTTHYRGWDLLVVPGRPCIGCASQRRAPYQIVMLKGFAAPSVLTALRRQVDEIEDDTGDAAG